MSDELWQKYMENKNDASREALIRHYLPLVKRIAGRLALGLPPQVEEEDLVAGGMIGLLEAINRYRPARGASFKTFATPRIRGAMLDELRRLSWAPRSLFRRLRSLQEAEQKLSHRLGREPEVKELARELDWTEEAVLQTNAQLNFSALVSLDALLFAPSAPEEEKGEELIAEENSFQDPAISLESSEKKKALKEALEKLPQREKLLLALYYKEGLTLKEVGKVLNITAARVSQLHARAIRLLREELQAAGYVEK